MVTVATSEIAHRVFEDLHRHPETGLRLPRTLETIRGALAGLPLELRQGVAVDSLVAILHGSRGGPVTILRADTDALPITEAATHALRSEEEGVMHACGHDAHAAMMVGAAHALAGARSAPAGPVVFLWQPGEEGHDGMGAMLAEGLMDTIAELGDERRTYGLHVLSDPAVPLGTFTGRPGASHAATATFEIVLHGEGGHAAFPHLASDPISALAQLVTALDVAMIRTRSPFDPGVLTVGTVSAGTAHNVIADRAVLTGTFRSYSQEAGAHITRLLHEVAAGVAGMRGLRSTVTVEPGYPAVVNDPACVRHFAEVVDTALGAGRFRPMESPLPAGDDYGRLLELVPGAFFMLGAGVPDAGGVLHPNHSPAVRFDDRVLEEGIAALAAIASDPLAKEDPS